MSRCVSLAPGQERMSVTLHGPFSAHLSATRKQVYVLSKMGARTPVTCMASTLQGTKPVDRTLNPKVTDLRPSKTMQLSDLASSLREAGKDIISLAAGEPDFDTPQPIIEAGFDAMRSSLTHYTPNMGTSALRKAISAKLRNENQVEYDVSEILVSNGAKQSIWQALLATLSPGDEVMMLYTKHAKQDRGRHFSNPPWIPFYPVVHHRGLTAMLACWNSQAASLFEVIIPSPYWTSYPSMSELAGGKPVIVETTMESGFLMSAQQLRNALKPASRILILCSPSNPTGSVYGPELLSEIAEVVAQHPRLLVLSDEIYEHIIYPPAKHKSFASLPGMWERTLTVNGFSKAFAMTGWRLGYLAAPKDFTRAAAAIQSQSTSGASSISQHAGVAALSLGNAGGPEVKAMVDAFQERRDYILGRLKELKGVRVTVPDGAFYVMPDFSAFCGPDTEAASFGPVPDVDALCRYLLEKALVALVPGDAFGAAGCARLSYAASMEAIREAMDRIERALQPEKFSVT